MSQVDSAHAWWSRLRHQGLLLSPVVMLERYPSAPEQAPFPATPRLRDAHTRFVSTSEARKAGDAEIEQSAIPGWVDHLLRPFLGHGPERVAKQHEIPEKFAAVVRIGSRSETLKPHRVVYADASGTVPAFLVMADTSAAIGRGRGRTKYAQFLELLRGTGHRLGLLTNGQQFRLVYAGLDFESWCEWESDRWFDDGEGAEELAGLRQLLSPESLAPAKEGVSGLLDAIEESRKRQADLSSVLRENVRQAVEFLLEDVSAANRTNPALFHSLKNPEENPALTDAQAYEALYQATVRLVMRLVVCLFAESRPELRFNGPIYDDSYGVRTLYERLEEATRHEGGVHTLFNQNTAWPRLMALFRLISGGSFHGSFPMRAFGGVLFRPGDAASGDEVARALHILEHSVSVGDATIHAVLRKLLRGPLPVLRGRQKTFVEGPVDYTDLRTEFIGLIYEGLLDYRIKRTDAEIGPQVFLNIGREPVLPLRRLEDMLTNDRNGLKNLLTTLRKEKVTATVSSDGDEEADDDAEDQADAAEGPEVELAAESAAEEEGLHGGDYLDAVESAKRWAREAAVLVGLTSKQGKRESDAEYQKRLEVEADRLIKRVVATGEFYLVRAGNTRKGTGTFYTRPQLAVPTVHRTLEPLCYDRAEDGTLTPKEPEAILGLKVCDPACGSASFLVAALHYLADALYRSLCHHRQLDDPERAKRITLPYGRPRTGKDGDELVPFNPVFQQFESGGGRVNRWYAAPADLLAFRPKYLISEADALAQAPGSHSLRYAFRDISSSTNERTLIGVLVPGFPCGNTLPVLRLNSQDIGTQALMAASGSSLACDYVARIRMIGSHMNLFVMEDIPFLRGERDSPEQIRIIKNYSQLALIHLRFAPEWLKLKQLYPELAGREWKHWWAVTEADRLRLRVEIDALCADLYGLDPDDFDWIVRDDPTDPKGFYRVDRPLPFRERLTGLAAAAFRALKDSRWSAESAASLSNDEFFALLGIPELTSAPAAHALGLPSPLIENRKGCHSWHPESFPPDDPRHGWTWDDCRNDAVALLGSEEAVSRYINTDSSSAIRDAGTGPQDGDDPLISRDLFGVPIPQKPTQKKLF